MTLAALLALAALAGGEDDPRPSPDGGLTLASGAVTALVGLDDLDGDGRDELALARVGWRTCGMEPFVGRLALFSGDLRQLSPSETLDAEPHLDASRASAGCGPRLLRIGHQAWRGTPDVELFALDLGRALWRRGSEELANGHVASGCLLPLEPGASEPDAIVVSPHTWSRDVRDDDGQPTLAGPVVLRLRGCDGTPLWAHRSDARGEAYGRFVTPAGDLDGDGVGDVNLVFAEAFKPEIARHHRPAYLEVLSGADGTLVGRRELPFQEIVHVEPLGDLDGDGLVDLALAERRASAAEPGRVALVLSGCPEPHAVAPQAHVDFLAPWTDVDGAPALLVALRERAGGRRRMELVGASGSLRTLDAPPRWPGRVLRVATGDFDGDGRRDLALVGDEPGEACGSDTVLAVLAGRELR